MRVEIIIPDALLRIGSRQSDAARLAFPTLTDRLKGKWQESVRTKAKNPTGRYERAIDVFENSSATDVLEARIDTSSNPDVTYSDVFERGRKDGANYYGRYAVKDVLDNAEPLIEDFITSVMDRTFK